VLKGMVVFVFETMVEDVVCVEGGMYCGVRCRGSKEIPTMDESGPLKVGDGVFCGGECGGDV